MSDPTAIAIATDPLKARMSGWTNHGNMSFNVPFITKVGASLYQGGYDAGLVLPERIKHVVSLYPWGRYLIKHEMQSELYVKMYDSEGQGMEQVDEIARWVNQCRETGQVLVHCQAGLNRSSLIAARALYLDGEFNDGDRIVEHLREVRSPAVLCNPAFEREVRSWCR